MKNALKTVLLAGERSEKITFIGSLINDSAKVILGDKAQGADRLRAVHSDSFTDSVEADNGAVTIISSLLPFGVMITADLSEKDWTTDIPNETELVLFLETYPFVTDLLLHRLCAIEQYLLNRVEKGIAGAPVFRVVFRRESGRRFNQTDIVTYDETLNKAPSEMADRLKNDWKYETNMSLHEIVDFKIYPDSDILEILSSGGKTMRYTSSVCRSRFVQWQSNLAGADDVYLLESFDFSDLTDKNFIFEYVTKFEVVQGSRCIFQTYKEKYREKFMGRILELAEKVYRELIREICFWDLNKDLEILRGRVYTLYNQSLEKNSAKDTECPSVKADYQILCNQSNISVNFNTAIQEFVDKRLKDFVKSYLREKETALMGTLDKN